MWTSTKKRKTSCIDDVRNHFHQWTNKISLKKKLNRQFHNVGFPVKFCLEYMLGIIQGEEVLGEERHHDHYQLNEPDYSL